MMPICMQADYVNRTRNFMHMPFSWFIYMCVIQVIFILL